MSIFKKIACGALRNLNVFETNKPTVTEELDGDFFWERGDLGPGGGDLGSERFGEGT